MTVCPPLIYFFTDFGSAGPYLGQMEAAVLAETFQARVINLCSDAPAHDPRRSSYLLAALSDHLPVGATVVCVVDPGVGSDRHALLVESNSMAFVGPDNGLITQVVRRNPEASVKRIVCRPDTLSASFHGRDLFAPVAANIAKGQPVETRPAEAGDLVGVDWPLDLAEVIYIDHYGNAFTGIRAAELKKTSGLLCGGQTISHGHTFSSVPLGQAFWYENSCGLVEIAINGGRADELLEIGIGCAVVWAH